MAVLGPEDCGSVRRSKPAFQSRWIQTLGWPQPESVFPGWRRLLTALWCRGREFASYPQTCPEGGTGSACRSPNPREGGLHRTGKQQIARIDEAEVRSVEEAEHKLTQLRALNTTQQEQPVGPTVADSRAEIQRLRAIVVDLQRQLEHSGGPGTAVGTNAARQRSREDFVPSCVDEMQQWIWDRQQDLQEARWHAAHTDVPMTGSVGATFLGVQNAFLGIQRSAKVVLILGYYIVCAPDRVGRVFRSCRTVPTSTCITARHKFWNRGGVVPRGVNEITRLARVVKLGAVVWKGDRELPVTEQGVKVLECPLAHQNTCRSSLQRRVGSRKFCSKRFRGKTILLGVPSGSAEAQVVGCLQEDCASPVPGEPAQPHIGQTGPTV